MYCLRPLLLTRLLCCTCTVHTCSGQTTMPSWCSPDVPIARHFSLSLPPLVPEYSSMQSLPNEVTFAVHNNALA
ncbi:hypothetical protein BGX38DRAFT_1216424 [Terfezia claveryi]|nr:hypothetical protein BGX38DRAFT_1216424 [Terfezia claveryi]